MLDCEQIYFSLTLPRTSVRLEARDTRILARGNGKKEWDFSFFVSENEFFFESESDIFETKSDIFESETNFFESESDIFQSGSDFFKSESEFFSNLTMIFGRRIRIRMFKWRRKIID